jgi:hypothetical protein
MAAIKDFKRSEKEKKAKYTMDKLRKGRVEYAKMAVPPDRKQTK